jgi:hypothetical protein
MHLLIARNQRDDGWIWSSMTFLLDVRLDLTDEEQELFDKYGLYDVVIYDSDARVQHAYSAIESYEASAEAGEAVPLFPAVEELHTALGNAFVSFWHLGAGATHSLLSMASLRITLGTLVSGQHLESESLEEILAVASEVGGATQYLAAYFDLALTFDGREDLSEY